MGDFLLPIRVFTHPGTVHELQIVHNDESNIMLCLQSPTFGSQFQDSQAWSIIDEYGCLAESTGCARKSRSVVVVQASSSSGLSINACFRGQQALGELPRAHFEREDGYSRGVFEIECSVSRHGKGKRRFPH